MTSYLHGQDLIGEEILKSFSAIQALKKFLSNSTIENKEMQKFIDMFSKFKTSNSRGVSANPGLVCILKTEFYFSEQTEICELIRAYDGTILENCFSTDKLKFNNIKYRTEIVLGRFNDSCIKVKNSNLYGIVKTFVIYNNNVYCVMRRIKNVRSPFNMIATKHTNSNEVKSSSFVSLETEELFVEKIQNIRKVFFLSVETASTKQNCFNSHEWTFI
jgi:hypothetical protein